MVLVLKKNQNIISTIIFPFSVGETGRIATGRRELVRALAERALKPVLPDFEPNSYSTHCFRNTRI